MQAAESLSYGRSAAAALESCWIEASEGAIRNIVARAGGAKASEPPAQFLQCAGQFRALGDQPVLDLDFAVFVQVRHVQLLPPQWRS